MLLLHALRLLLYALRLLDEFLIFHQTTESVQHAHVYKLLQGDTHSTSREGLHDMVAAGFLYIRILAEEIFGLFCARRELILVIQPANSNI